MRKPETPAGAVLNSGNSPGKSKQTAKSKPAKCGRCGKSSSHIASSALPDIQYANIMPSMDTSCQSIDHHQLEKYMWTVPMRERPSLEVSPNDEMIPTELRDIVPEREVYWV